MDQCVFKLRRYKIWQPWITFRFPVVTKSAVIGKWETPGESSIEKKEYNFTFNSSQSQPDTFYIRKKSFEVAFDSVR